jgi:hypothetical protein
MFQFTVKGTTLEEVKKSLAQLNEELNGTVKPVKQKLEIVKIPEDQTVYISPGISPVVQAPQVATPVQTPQALIPAAFNDFTNLDAEGLPWDQRIHTDKKTKMTTGIWKLARGTDKDLVVAVKNELRSKIQNVQSSTSVAPVVQVPQVVVQAAPVAQTTTPAVQAVAPIIPPMTPPVLTTGHTLETFKNNFPLIISGLISEGKLTADYINSLNQFFGVTQIWTINDSQKAQVFEQFAQYGLIQKV